MILVDKIFITNLPSFYKINLYNGIAKEINILVIFTGDSIGPERNKDFFYQKAHFNYIYLKKGKFQQILQIKKILLSHSFREIIIGGWDSIPNWFVAFFFKESKKSLIVESSYFESKSNGTIGLIKKIFLTRIQKVYVSGISQEKLIRKLQFKGEIIKTGGVGIFDIKKQPALLKVNDIKKFIYVGRLSKEKNLVTLISVFKNLPDLELSIFGFGPLENQIKDIIKNINNINFYGYIKNKQLPLIYKRHHVFILPSISEPWGLVVEEALNNGLPVIVSNRVGCAEEIVIEGENGLIFSIDKIDTLEHCIKKITNKFFYNKLSLNISQINFFKNAQRQISSYIK